MSDEEKEVLRNFKSEYETCDHYSSDLIIELDDAEILLNLIDKQSKEIEELKEDLKKKKPMFLIKDIYSPKIKEINLQDIEGLIEQGREEVKDKIKAKIEEYKEKCKNCNFRGKICEDLTKNYNCTIAVCLNEFYSLLKKE